MTGWECPKCGAVWAPFVAGCDRCNAPALTTVMSGGTTVTSGRTNICPHCQQSRLLPPTTACPSGSHLANWTWTVSYHTHAGTTVS